MAKKKNIRVRLGNKADSKPANVGSTPTTFAYKLTLKSLGRLYKSEGTTLKEALAGIKVMGNARAVSVLVVEKGDRRVEKIILPVLAQRYFSNGGPTMKEYALNKITELIGL